MRLLLTCGHAQVMQSVVACQDIWDASLFTVYTRFLFSLEQTVLTALPKLRHTPTSLPHILPMPRFVEVGAKAEAFCVVDQPKINFRLHLDGAI